MKSKTLAKILTSRGQGTEKEGTIVISDEANITIYANLGTEALMIADVKSITIDDEMAVAETGKGDIFAVALEDVRVLRIGPQIVKKSTGLIRS